MSDGSHGHVSITGGVAGLGTAMVHRLLGDGHEVIAADRDTDTSESWLGGMIELTAGGYPVRGGDRTVLVDAGSATLRLPALQSGRPLPAEQRVRRFVV